MALHTDKGGQVYVHPGNRNTRRAFGFVTTLLGSDLAGQKTPKMTMEMTKPSKIHVPKSLTQEKQSRNKQWSLQRPAGARSRAGESCCTACAGVGGDGVLAGLHANDRLSQLLPG